MSVTGTLNQLLNCPLDKKVVCQVVDQKGEAWQMEYEFVNIPNTNLVMLKVSHPDLKELPEEVKLGPIKLNPVSKR